MCMFIVMGLSVLCLSHCRVLCSLSVHVFAGVVLRCGVCRPNERICGTY
jgi:hypothetical protein